MLDPGTDSGNLRVECHATWEMSDQGVDNAAEL